MSEVKIAGRYRLEGRLGFGGMSTVHLALDLRLERQVAVKLLAEHLADDPTFVSRFQREAQAAARLVHPNIVQIFDSGLDEPSGRHFIVMEYIEGSSCAEILRDDGWLEVDEAVSIIEQACEGLDYAHQYTQPIMGHYQHPLLNKDTGVYSYDELIVLRKTRMPAVLLEAGSIINRDEELKMNSTERRDLISGAVVAAVKEFCSPPAPQATATVGR